MTGEPMYTASKERMVPELMFSSPAIKNCFESAVVITLCFQLCSARYTVLQTKNSRISAFATIQSPRKYDNLCAPNYQLLPQKCSGYYASLLAVFSPLHSITNKEQC